MAKIFPILIFLLLNIYSFAQQSLGIKVSGGISKINSRQENPPPGITTIFNFAPSGQAGFFYEADLGKRSVIGAELLFTQMASKEIIEATDMYNAAPVTYIFHQDLQISYLSLPVYYGFKIKRLSLTLGWQTSIQLANQYKFYADENQGVTITSGGEGEADLELIDVGPKAGLKYDFTKRFAAEMTYYYGVSDILGGGQWHLMQLTAGLRYKFWVKNKKESGEL